MPRASWKGFLRLSLVSCPVYMSAATSRTKAIRLNQVWYHAPGQPSRSRIDLTSFVPRAEIAPLYFNTPYYVYPDGSVAAEAYRTISAAMAEAGMAGLGRL